MKLTLVISTLTCGGAERVMTLLANEWVRRGNAVQLLTLDREPPFFPLDPRVTLVQLDCERPSPTPVHAVWNLRRSVSLTRKAIRSFGTEAVLSFTTRVNVKTLMAARGLNIPVVISERTDPTYDGIPRTWKKLAARWYPRAHRLVVQTPGVVTHYRNQGLERVSVIPNPVEPTGTRAKTPEAGPMEWLTVARLSQEKGIDLLVKAWARSVQARVGRLTILGDGPERVELEALVRDLGVADQVKFAGFVSDKVPYWETADGFVLSSRIEGFPNALCEALAAGVPCVSFDCPSGPGSILRPDENGILVPPMDIDSLAAALDRLSGDLELRKRFALEGPKILDTLGLGRIADLWEGAWKP